MAEVQDATLIRVQLCGVVLGIPTISNIVVIGMRDGSWDEILKTFISQRGHNTCTFSYKQEEERWQVGACQLIISRS